MSNFLLVVNRVPVPGVRLRITNNITEVVMTDPIYGSFPISPSCDILYLNLDISPSKRDAMPNKGWRRVSLSSLKFFLETSKADAEPED